MNIERERLTLTKEEATELVNEGLDGFEDIEDKYVTRSRWSLTHRIVVKRLSDGKLFAGHYDKPATECQENEPFEHRLPKFLEVFPKKKTVTVYE